MSARTFLLGAAAATAALTARKILNAATAGEGHSAKHRALDAASAALQRKHPIEAMSTFLNGFHFYADDMGRQVEACLFCTHLHHDLHQCVIYDRNAPDARLIGIEYIISAERFRSLPDEEKRLWHSHHYEIKSGELIAPGIPELAERTYFHDLVKTYGKTFHMWQVDRDDFPFGIPQLMMAFTQDGQLAPGLVAARDRRYGVNMLDRRSRRASIPSPDVIDGADSWQSGRTWQTDLRQLPFGTEAQSEH